MNCEKLSPIRFTLSLVWKPSLLASEESLTVVLLTIRYLHAVVLHHPKSERKIFLALVARLC